MRFRLIKCTALLCAVILFLEAAVFPVPGFAADETYYSFIPYKAQGKEVLDMQKRLKELGYYNDRFILNPEVFDEGTWFALKNFCAYNNIYLDENKKGASAQVQRLLFADSAKRAPTPSPTPTPASDLDNYEFIPYGATGDQVYKVQERLKALDYYQGDTTFTWSVFDAATQKALELFCSQNKLTKDPTDGISPKLQQALFSESAQPYISPEKPKQSLPQKFADYMTGDAHMFGMAIPMYVVWIYSVILIVLILILVIHFFVPEKGAVKDAEEPRVKYWRHTDALKRDSVILTQGKVYGNTDQLIDIQIYYGSEIKSEQHNYNQKLTIGRGNCDIVLNQNDRTVSNNHCDIYLRGSFLVLQDHSRNGTLINGKRVHNSECRISSGDRLTVGKHEITIQF